MEYFVSNFLNSSPWTGRPQERSDLLLTQAETQESPSERLPAREEPEVSIIGLIIISLIVFALLSYLIWKRQFQNSRFALFTTILLGIMLPVMALIKITTDLLEGPEVAQEEEDRGEAGRIADKLKEIEEPPELSKSESLKNPEEVETLDFPVIPVPLEAIAPPGVESIPPRPPATAIPYTPSRPTAQNPRSTPSNNGTRDPEPVPRTSTPSTQQNADNLPSSPPTARVASSPAPRPPAQTTPNNVSPEVGDVVFAMTLRPIRNTGNIQPMSIVARRTEVEAIARTSTTKQQQPSGESRPAPQRTEPSSTQSTEPSSTQSTEPSSTQSTEPSSTRRTSSPSQTTRTPSSSSDRSSSPPSRELPSTVTFRDSLMTGDRSINVKVLQTILRTLGFYTGVIDGYFGLDTQRAVAAFQREYNLVADGVFGFSTCNILKAKIEEEQYDIDTEIQCSRALDINN